VARFLNAFVAGLLVLTRSYVNRNHRSMASRLRLGWNDRAGRDLVGVADFEPSLHR
jgi:hypothetical protein